MIRCILFLIILLTNACSKPSESGSIISGAIDSPIGSSPKLHTILPVSTYELVNYTSILDASDSASGFDTNSNGVPIIYECFYDTDIDGTVNETNECQNISGLNFNPQSGVLYGKPSSDTSGRYEILIKGTSERLSDEVITTVQIFNLNQIFVSLSESERNIGESTSATATAIYENGWIRSINNEVSWSVSDTLKATVDMSGNVITNNPGITVVQAELDRITGQASLQIFNSALSYIRINQTTHTLPLNGSKRLNATAFYNDGRSVLITNVADWTSLNSSIATVSNVSLNKGQLSAINEGTTQIEIRFGGMTHMASVEVTNQSIVDIVVTPVNSSGIIGIKQTFSATAFLSNNTTIDVTDVATWSSSDSAKLNIASNGVATLLSAGIIDVTAEYGSFSGQTRFTISSATIRSISIQSPSPIVTAGFNLTFSAIAEMSNGSIIDITSSALWSVSNSSLASISSGALSPGRLSALSTGHLTVTASLGATSSQTSIEITNGALNSISLQPSDSFMWKGETKKFTALGTFADGTTIDISEQVIWSTSDNTKLTVDNSPGQRGYARTLYDGTTTQNLTITATMNTISKSINIIINPANLIGLQINESNVVVKTETTKRLSVFGQYSDGGSVNLTSSALWLSSNETIGYISNAITDKGLIYALAEGSTNIQAKLNGISSNIVTVEIDNDSSPSSQLLGTGLKASYFSGRTFNTLKGVRIDSSINFSWDRGNAPLGVGDQFSIRWEGQIRSPETASCRFHAYSDDGFRVYLNNTLILNDWSDHAPRWSQSNWINLNKNEMSNIRVEFYENSGQSFAQLQWECTNHFAQTTIPQEYLYPAQ